LSKKHLLIYNLDLLKLILPETLVGRFDLIASKQNEEILYLYFEESNITPIEHSYKILVSKGFMDEITIQDFPLRGK
jgi:hypothetical protein